MLKQPTFILSGVERLVPWESAMDTTILPIAHQSKQSLLRFIASRYPKVSNATSRNDLETQANIIIANEVPPIPCSIDIGDDTTSISWIPVITPLIWSSEADTAEGLLSKNEEINQMWFQKYYFAPGDSHELTGRVAELNRAK